MVIDAYSLPAWGCPQVAATDATNPVDTHDDVHAAAVDQCGESEFVLYIRFVSNRREDSVFNALLELPRIGHTITECFTPTSLRRRMLV